MFDTLRYSKVLEAAGISRDQAEAHVRIIADIVEGDLSTKQDIQDLKNELRKLEYRLVIKLGAVIGTVISVMAAVLTIINSK